jgi:cytochrome c553
MLLANKNEPLAKFTKAVKIPEMIISTLFLVTGIYMLFFVPINTILIIKILIVFASIPLAVVGFKKGNKVLAVISLILIISAYGLAEIRKKKQKESSSSNEETITTMSGQDIFAAKCTSCHGSDGKLGAMGAPDLTTSSKDINSRIELIKNGSPLMNGFGGSLSDEQIKAVAEYTETLKK